MVNDELIIQKICSQLHIKLNKIEIYSSKIRGYLLNTEGRVEVLNLGNFGITKLPECINELTELKILNVGGNQLRTIEMIAGLSKLEILYLQGNYISDISVVKNFKLLKELYLKYNLIASLIPLTLLQNITHLSIGNITDLSIRVISELNKLEVLSIYWNEWVTPVFLLDCKNLRDLSINGDSMNGFKKKLTVEIYDSFKKMKLSRLNLYNFESIAFEKIVELSSLKELIISFCNLRNISVISKLKHLETLCLSHNEIEDIRSLVNLKKLKYLDLAVNKIKNVTPLEKLSQLTAISLRKNPVVNIEPLLSMGLNFVYDDKDKQQLPLENEILISECKDITNPPIEIANQGNEAIQRYFKKVEDEGLDYIYEAKLILVGEGGAGKTSLQRRLLNENAQLPEGENRTRGIEVVDFIFEKGKNKASKTVHIWDFGGQDVYYPVHRFFITENSVFVLMASTRQPFHNFDYWIPTIFQFGGKSPIIIGQTCHQGNTTPWNELDIYVSNPNFNIIKTQEIPFYRVDLINKNAGLAPVKNIILSQIKNLHHFGKGVPKSWLLIRYSLIEKSKVKACIPFQTFIDLCREHTNFQDIQNVEDCCRFFHDIGALLWYSQIEELKDWVILEVEWAMNAVYKIIDDIEIQERNGIIQHADFSRLWHHKSYEGKYSILKKLLINFKIAFPTKHSNGEYIMPARLTSIPIEMKWDLEANCLRLEYTFEFMPKGIVNQLSAELSRYIHKYEVWNNAVNLAYNKNNTKSQIIEDSYNRKLSIMSKGVDARGMNILIMDAMRNIIDSYKGVKEEIYVTCSCSICQKLEKPTTFNYLKLMDWSLKRENAKATCNESGEMLTISELLYNVGFKNSSQKDTIKEMKEITIFLASSQELENDRKEFEIFINRENKHLFKERIFLRLEIWEDFIDLMSKTRLQDEYNVAVINSDIFLSLFWTKVGKYSAEEFNNALKNFQKNGKPYIYTYFKNAPVSPNDIKEDDMLSKFKFLKDLKDLGHYPTNYDNIEDLKYQFKMQLQKILPRLK